MPIRRTSNTQIKATLNAIGQYMSKYSGEEVDNAIGSANSMAAFLTDNVIVPMISFTGDFMSQTVTTLTRDMWLESIVLKCTKAFSQSYKEITYEIALGTGATLLSIPNEFMVDEGNTLIYYINQVIPVDSQINAVCSSTKAFGQLDIKLNFR